MSLRLAAVLALLMVPAVLWAADTSALRPPKGARVALVAFEDLQCPDCAAAEPLLEEASAKYGIPLVRHDFPLPKHNWAFEAHVIARYFDTAILYERQSGKPAAGRGVPALGVCQPEFDQQR